MYIQILSILLHQNEMVFTCKTFLHSLIKSSSASFVIISCPRDLILTVKNLMHLSLTKSSPLKICEKIPPRVPENKQKFTITLTSNKHFSALTTLHICLYKCAHINMHDNTRIQRCRASFHGWTYVLSKHQPLLQRMYDWVQIFVQK